MATFTGTIKELRRYIGPRLRNLVQQFTKTLKANVAACQHCGCGNSENLESAHVSGRDRNQIIDIVASEYTSAEIITVELSEFEERFKAEHKPIEKSILILCRTCHRKYDAKKQSSSQIQPVGNSSTLGQAPANDNDLLPITLDPSNPENFKQELLKTKTAKIVSYYSNGRTEEKTWSASRFSASSNVMRNLRSRPEFRSENWQAHGIVKVHVEVIRNA